MTTHQGQISSSRGGQDSSLRIEIRDNASRELLAQFRLDPEQAWKLTGGATVYADVHVSPNLHRLGKQMVNDSVIYPVSSFDRSAEREEMLREAEERASADRPGWHTYSARATNTGGVQVIMRRWEEQ